LLDTFLFNY